MNLQERIKAFAALGHKIQSLPTEQIQELAQKAKGQNNWFIKESVSAAFEGIRKMLDEQLLNQWAEKYPALAYPVQAKKIGVVMAGNIPMVGFHDFLCVLLSGHKLLAKLSSQDSFLMKTLAQWLTEIEPRFSESIQFADRLNEADAYIATGSDNTARYFHHYFGKKPNIIRANRTSLAVLSETETEEDFQYLGKDIFQYFGLGCRNVSKLFVPAGFSFPKLLNALQSFEYVAKHHKYVNNYDYNKSIFLVNRVEHLDTGFLLLRESEETVSPISVLHYEYYQSESELKKKLELCSSKTQCVTGKGFIPFGQAQLPSLDDYADGIDTMHFLTTL